MNRSVSVKYNQVPHPTQDTTRMGYETTYPEPPNPSRKLPSDLTQQLEHEN